MKIQTLKLKGPISQGFWACKDNKRDLIPNVEPFLLFQLHYKDNYKIQLHYVLYRNRIGLLDTQGYTKSDSGKAGSRALQWFLVFNFSLAKEKTSAVFIAAITVGGVLLRLMLSLRGQNQLNVLRRICFFLDLEGYPCILSSIEIQTERRMTSTLLVASCRSVWGRVSFLRFSFKQNLWSDHVLIFGLEMGTL